MQHIDPTICADLLRVPSICILSCKQHHDLDSMDVVRQLNRLIDQTDVMTGALFEMKQEISEQTHSINHIEYNLASYKRKESFDKQNSIGTLRIKDGTESKKSLLSFLSIPLKMSNYSYV